MTRTTLLVALALVALALAACGGQSGNSPQEQCRQQAYEDPGVKDAIIRANSKFQQVRIPALREQDYLTKQAVQRCLAEHGLAPRGGVEPLRLQQ